MFDSVRRRISLTPQRTPPVPVMQRNHTQLSREDINEILDSPYGTNYTYSESAAYKPHIGPREYIHPRLCRRFPATPSPIRPNAWQWTNAEWMHWEQWSRTMRFETVAWKLFQMLQFIFIFSFTCVQYCVTRVYHFFLALTIRIFRFITIRLLKYTILAPILAPYFALMAYWNQAKFILRTSHSIWSFLSWTWCWWTGQEFHAREETPRTPTRVQTRASAARGRVLEMRTKGPNHAKWVLVYVPILFLLLAAAYHLYTQKYANVREKAHLEQIHAEAKKGPHKGSIPQSKPSDQSHPPHLGQPLDVPTRTGNEPAPIFSKFHHAKERIGTAARNLWSQIVAAFDSMVSSIGHFISSTFSQVKQLFLFCAEIPSRIGHFIWHRICLPIGHSLRDVALYLYEGLKQKCQSMADSVFSFEWFTNPIRDFFQSTYARAETGISSAWMAIKEYAFRCLELVKRLIVWTKDVICSIFISGWHLMSSLIAHLWRIIGQIGSGGADLLAFGRETATNALVWIKDCLVASAVWIKEGAIRLIVWTKEGICSIFIFAWHLLSSFITNVCRIIGQIANTGLNILLFGWERATNGLVWIKDCLVASAIWIKECVLRLIVWTKDGLCSISSSAWQMLNSPISHFYRVIGQIGSSVTDLLALGRETATNGFVWIKDCLLSSAVWIKEGVLRLVVWTKEGLCSTFVSAWHLLNSLIANLWHLTAQIANTGLDILLYGRGTAANCFVWMKDSLIACGNSVGDALYMAGQKMAESTTQFGGAARELGVETIYLTGRAICWPIEKLSSAAVSLTNSVIFALNSIVYHVTESFSRIWHSAKEFHSVPHKQEENTEKAPCELNTHLADDHPLMQQFRRILVEKLAEERQLTERRMSEWEEQSAIEFNAKMRQTMQKDEKRVFGPMDELKAKMAKELEQNLDAHKAEWSKNLRTFEEQLDAKIRVLIEQLRSQNETLLQQMEQLNQRQEEIVNAKEGKMIAASGENVTVVKESTLIVSLMKQLEHLDEKKLMERVRMLILEELRRYDADRTGIPDYALESSGGSVLSTRCTVQYNERSRTQKLFGIPLWYSSYSPRTVIQRKGGGTSAGECWAYHGGQGFLTLSLSKRINVTAVSYEHLPVELSPDGHIRTAPRNFVVWSYQEVDDTQTRLLLGNFTFDVERGEPLQMFHVQHWDPRGTQIVELETLTNWGAPITCLYRFRVHGDRLEPIPEVSEEEMHAYASEES